MLPNSAKWLPDQYKLALCQCLQAFFQFFQKKKLAWNFVKHNYFFPWPELNETIHITSKSISWNLSYSMQLVSLALLSLKSAYKHLYSSLIDMSHLVCLIFTKMLFCRFSKLLRHARKWLISELSRRWQADFVNFGQSLIPLFAMFLLS